MKNSFSISRFWQVLKWTLANDQQRIVKLLMVYTFMLASIFLLIINHRISYIDEVSLIQRALKIVTLAYGMLMTLLIITPSLTMRSMNKNRQHRLNTLMLPATNSEKFIALIITAFVTYIVTFIVAFFIADAIQYVVTLIFHPDKTICVTSQLTLSDLYQHQIDFQDTNTLALEYANSIIMTLWLVSVYLLGGMFFRRYAWLFVNCGFFLTVICIGIAASYIKDDNYYIEIDLNAFGIATCCIFTVLTLLNLWLSYRLFRRTQLINHKLINI